MNTKTYSTNTFLLRNGSNIYLVSCGLFCILQQTIKREREREKRETERALYLAWSLLYCQKINSWHSTIEIENLKLQNPAIQQHSAGFLWLRQLRWANNLQLMLFSIYIKKKIEKWMTRSIEKFLVEITKPA